MTTGQQFTTCTLDDGPNTSPYLCCFFFLFSLFSFVPLGIVLKSTRHKVSALTTQKTSFLQGEPDSIRQFLIINKQSIQQHTGKMGKYLLLSIDGSCHALHLSLSWARPVKSEPLNLIPARSILIVCTHVRLGLPSGLFLSGFPTNNLFAFLFSPIRVTCSAYLILLDLIFLVIFG
jgi:hypothetical protein